MIDLRARRKEVWRARRFVVCLPFLLAGCASGAPGTKITQEGVTKSEASVIADRGLPAVIRDSTVKDSSYGKLIREAVLRYPSVSGQRARTNSAASRLSALKGSMLPQLSTGVSAGQAVAGDNAGSTASAFIRVRQLIFDGSATKNRIALTRANQKQLELETEVLLSGLSRRIVAASVNLWEQTQLLKLAEANVAIHEEFVAQTQERMLGGATTESDLLSSRSRLADVQSERAQTVAALEQARASYIALIGPLPVETTLPPPLPRLDDGLVRTRIETSSQLEIAKMRVTSAQAELDVARSGRYPGIFLELTGRQTDLLTEDADKEVFAGFSLDQSLFSGGQQRAREEQAASNLLLAKSAFEESKLEIRRQLDVALANRSATEAQAVTAADAVRANAAVLDASRAQFSIGRRGIVEILDAQRDLTTARVREIALQGIRIRTELEILELVGDLAPVFGIRGGSGATGSGSNSGATAAEGSQNE